MGTCKGPFLLLTRRAVSVTIIAHNIRECNAYTRRAIVSEFVWHPLMAPTYGIVELQAASRKPQAEPQLVLIA